MSKKILVLGGGGFIGRNLSEALVQKGNHVIAADIKAGSNWPALETFSENSSSFENIVGDFSQQETFQMLPSDVDEIYMLAAIVGVNRTLKNPEEVIRTNTNLTMNTLSWVRENPINKIVFASSSENYAGTTDLFECDIPTSETVPLCISDIKHPRWTYAISKIHGEAAFLHSSKALGYECSIVRYQNIIGPEMGFGHAIPHIVERFIKNDSTESFKIYGSEQTRAFCHVRDAVEGTIGAMVSSRSSDNVYHIGNREEITINTLTRFIGDYLDYEGPYEDADTYPGSVSRRCPNIEQAFLDFDYKPSFSWQEAVQATVDWYEDYFKQGNEPINGGFEPPERVIPKLN